MPSILSYALEADLQLLRDRLNADPEIAFLVGAGSGRWRAASGQGAQVSTLRWWRAMQRWISGLSHPVPRGGLQATRKADVAAFPAALARFEAGAAGELNPPAT